MSTTVKQQSRVNVFGILALVVAIVAIGVSIGRPWTIMGTLPCIVAVILGIVAVTRTGREQITGIIGIVLGAAPVAVGLVLLVANMSSR